jgi:hypothetical protein
MRTSPSPNALVLACNHAHISGTCRESTGVGYRFEHGTHPHATTRSFLLIDTHYPVSRWLGFQDRFNTWCHHPAATTAFCVIITGSSFDMSTLDTLHRQKRLGIYLARRHSIPMLFKQVMFPLLSTFSACVLSERKLYTFYSAHVSRFFLFYTCMKP